MYGVATKFCPAWRIYCGAYGDAFIWLFLLWPRLGGVSGLSARGEMDTDATFWRKFRFGTTGALLPGFCTLWLLVRFCTCAYFLFCFFFAYGLFMAELSLTS